MYGALEQEARDYPPIPYLLPSLFYRVLRFCYGSVSVSVPVYVLCA
jgi:hypothetical protein